MAEGRTYPSRPVLAVSAAVIRADKVLIVRRARPPAHGLYTLPGGGVEVGENLHEAVAREGHSPCTRLSLRARRPFSCDQLGNSSSH
jgi:ADP-ribose pyrophosphatase YjhB (NUDIX family)